MFCNSYRLCVSVFIPLVFPPETNDPGTLISGVVVNGFPLSLSWIYWKRVSLIIVGLTVWVSVTCRVFSTFVEFVASDARLKEPTLLAVSTFRQYWYRTLSVFVGVS